MEMLMYVGAIGIVYGGVLMYRLIATILRVGRVDKQYLNPKFNYLKVWLIVPIALGLVFSYLLYLGYGDWVLALAIISYVIVEFYLIGINRMLDKATVKNFSYIFPELEKARRVLNLVIDGSDHRDNKIIANELSKKELDRMKAISVAIFDFDRAGGVRSNMDKKTMISLDGATEFVLDKFPRLQEYNKSDKFRSKFDK